MATQQPSAPQSDAPRGPLLVVDDEEANRDMLARRLQRAGYRVEVAESGPQALELLDRRPFDLVLLDIMMPGMSGIELLRLLRATDSPDELPVIMVSALNDSAQIVEALNLGANDYVTKPVDFLVARARIESQLTRKRAEEALRKSEERYALAVRGANDGLWDWDLEQGTVYYSPRWKQMLGFRDEEIGVAPAEWLGRIHPEDRPGFDAELTRHLAPGGPPEFVSEHRLRQCDGTYRWVLSRGIVLRAPDGRARRMAGSLTDITESKAFDPLTSLPNRVLFTDQLERALGRMKAGELSRFAVLFVDLDHFKIINDSLGHLLGDRLLVEVSRRLLGAVRSHPARGRRDLVARLGGDEFAILLEDLHEDRDAELVARRILERLQEPFALDGKEAFTGASIGIAEGTPEYASAMEILRDADTAMYRAKALGRSCCVVFDAEMRARAIERLELENDLRKALERHELVVYYQPKMELAGGALRGFEALLRWRHPKRGLLGPSEFIPIAEETGLIVPIGLWTLREACRTMRRWLDEFPQPSRLEMSVNVSARQFRQPDFVDQVAQILAETGLSPERLQLEITETVLMEDRRAALSVLERLKALGVGLKIDDFGTGYSSLNYLSEFPFDSLKIDRSFVLHLGQDNNALEVVKTILSLGETLRLEVVAEGVETIEQLETLKELGCRFGQGYYFAAPMDAESARTFAAEQQRCAGSTPPAEAGY